VPARPDAADVGGAEVEEPAYLGGHVVGAVVEVSPGAAFELVEALEEQLDR
jgi:hypothetical protein